MYYRIPLTLTPQPEGGFVVTSPTLPELITEGDSVQDAIENAYDAFETVVEIYEDRGRSLPEALEVNSDSDSIELDIACPISVAMTTKKNGPSELA
jgi:antitoxin HicB